MTGLDWFVLKKLGCPAYLRYVDDFALFADSKLQLWEWKRAVIDFLATQRLTVHESAAQVQPTATGIPWLGFVVYPTHRRLKRRNAVNFTRRLRHNIDLYAAGRITFAEFDASVQGWINHVRHGDTWGLRRTILRSVRLKQPGPTKTAIRHESNIKAARLSHPSVAVYAEMLSAEHPTTSPMSPAT